MGDVRACSEHAEGKITIPSGGRKGGHQKPGVLSCRVLNHTTSSAEDTALTPQRKRRLRRSGHGDSCRNGPLLPTTITPRVDGNSRCHHRFRGRVLSYCRIAFLCVLVCRCLREHVSLSVFACWSATPLDARRRRK